MGLRRFASDSLILRDLAFSVPVAVIVVMAAATGDASGRLDGALAMVLYAANALVILPFRRSNPIGSWIAALVAAVVLPPLLHCVEPSIIVLSFSTYTLLASTDRVEPWLAGSAALASALCGSVAMDVQLQGVQLDTILMPVLSVGYGAGLGALVGVNRRVAADLAERNAELIELGDLARREAVLAERARIARDLHDIVAHHVSGMVLHARGARDQLGRSPDVTGAMASLRTIADSGTEALTSMRGLLAMLRDDQLELGPQPGLDDLPALIETMAARGLPSELVLVHEPDDGDVRVAVPADVQLSAFRIVQEALTNASRHSSARRCTVKVDCRGEGVDLWVDDDGIGPGLGFQEGHGLVGMRERASLVGGDVSIATSPSGGWRVAAHLPIVRATPTTAVAQT